MFDDSLFIGKVIGCLYNASTSNQRTNHTTKRQDTYFLLTVLLAEIFEVLIEALMSKI